MPIASLISDGRAAEVLGTISPSFLVLTDWAFSSMPNAGRQARPKAEAKRKL
jgi:hypothetical protein